MSEPETDALTEPGALMEAALIDVRLDGTTGDLWLLFDCRGAIQIQESNTAIVVVHGVSDLRWTATLRRGRTWRSVMGWEPTTTADGLLRLRAGLEPDTDLDVVGTSGQFYVGNVAGGNPAPPDFTRATDDEIAQGLAGWSSEIDIVSRSSR